MVHKKETLEEKRKRAYAAVAAMPEGQAVLKHIFSVCAYDESLVRINEQGEINVQASMYMLARREVWRAMQPYLSLADRQIIEVGGNDVWMTQDRQTQATQDQELLAESRELQQ